MANSALLTGKSVIVTGGVSGIGLALVRFFASYNCKIAILDISEAAAQSVPPSLQKEFPSATFFYQRCDVSNWEEQKSAFERLYKETGSIDVVCANAGVVEIGKFLRVDEGEPLRPNLKTLDIDLNGALYSIKLGVHYMRKKDKDSRHKGLIVCTSSNAGIYPFPLAPLYAVSKHGVIGAVRSFAKPLAEEGIQINALAPNCIETNLSGGKVMSSMRLTPMSTLLDAVKQFCENTALTGVVAEISGEKPIFREHPKWIDGITEYNLAMFDKLGYA